MKAPKTTWNLGLLYQGNHDPKLERDIRKIEKAYLAFEKKHRNKSFTKTPQALAQALKDEDRLAESLENCAPTWYLRLKTDLSCDDTESAAQATKYEQRLTEAANRIKFFSLAIGKIPKEKQGSFLKHPSLKSYAYDLKQTFDNAKYLLSEQEEQLDDLLSQPGFSMWVETQEKLLSKQSVDHKGRKLLLSEASAKISVLKNKKERKELHEKINIVLKSVSPMAEGELNAIYNYKKIMDNRRGLKNPYTATILGYENDEQAIIKFTALVSKYFKIAHRFYKLHAKLLGEKQINLSDRNVKIGEIKTKFDFPKSVEVLQSALATIDKQYLVIFNRFLEQGQFDVFPKKGKQSGAYCSSVGKLPTFVFLNHTDDVRSLETLSHEMGHALHSELSKMAQPARYRPYSMATAEVASTFFEQVIGAELEKRLPKKEQVILLHNRLSGDIATIFRQIACFNFELELHERIRKEGQVPKEEIAKLMKKHLESYLGKAVNVSQDDGYFFIYWSHIRRFFYVYTYAYGQIVSRALFEKWKQNPKYAQKIKQFLSAGGSMSPEDIFKSIGVDTSKPSFFEAGLKAIDQDIDRLEGLVLSLKS